MKIIAKQIFRIILGIWGTLFGICLLCGDYQCALVELIAYTLFMAVIVMVALLVGILCSKSIELQHALHSSHRK